MKSKKQKKGKIWIFAIIILFVVSTGIGFVIQNSLPNLITDKEEITGEVLETSIESLKTLSTNEASYRDVLIIDNKRIFSYKVYATYAGVIKAGVDLEKAECEIIVPSKEDTSGIPVVNIVVPHSTIISNVIPSNGKPKIKYEEGSAKNHLASIEQLLKEQQKEKEKQLIKEGFLKEADKNAEEYITDFVKCLYKSDVDVVVEFKR